MKDLGIAGFPSWAKIWRLERAGHLGAQLLERVRIKKVCKMILGLVTTAFLARLCNLYLISQAPHTCSGDRMEAGKVGLEGKAYRGQARVSASLDDFKHTHVLNPIRGLVAIFESFKNGFFLQCMH